MIQRIRKLKGSVVTIKPETHQHLHNQGQEDAAKGYGNYDPPHGFIHTVLSDRLKEENDAYREGYSNVAKQRGTW